MENSAISKCVPKSEVAGFHSRCGSISGLAYVAMQNAASSKIVEFVCAKGEIPELLSPNQ
jgi:hypothetical protein